MAAVLENLAAAMAPNGTAVWLVGDSAPYGVYVDTPVLIGSLAEQLGFTVMQDVALRKRGNRWSLQGRHNHELSERLLIFRRDS
jgi:hypothetical protein